LGSFWAYLRVKLVNFGQFYAPMAGNFTYSETRPFLGHLYMVVTLGKSQPPKLTPTLNFHYSEVNDFLTYKGGIDDEHAFRDDQGW
jgi:hypothetical protein